MPQSRAPDPRPLFVICDRCRVQGLSDEDPFEAFGALIDFDPVPRRNDRADGWSAEVQRAYIAALSLTGSDRAACRAVGKSVYGVKQLIAHEGSEGFRAAREEALAIAADERSRRLGEGLRAVAAEEAGWRPPEGPWANAKSRGRPPGRAGAPLPKSRADGEEDSEEAKLEWFSGIVRKYLIKIEQERTARLDGRIVEADFYVRQVTWLEVALDMTTTDGLKFLRDFRVNRYHLIAMAETPMSAVLGELRREKWAELGEPSRPEHPPRRYLEDHGRFSSEPPECTRSGLPESHEEQRRAFEERHRRDAEAQLEWEARALAEAEAWRARLEREQASRPPAEEPGDDGGGGGDGAE